LIEQQFSQKMIREFANIQQVSIAAVRQIIDLAQEAVMEKGFCTIVLAGGSTPQQTYKLLSAPPNDEQMPWQQSHFFWGDERLVASTHPDSNFSMAYNALFSKVPIPQENIHQIPTENKNPVVDAEMYEEHLHDFFHSQTLNEKSNKTADMIVPSFDLVLLGMGRDGHTASLFPGSNLLEEKKKWVAAVPEGVGSPPVARVTLTLPILNQAKNVLFLISGNKNREILQTILRRPGEAEVLYPAARIKPAGDLVWLVAEQD
jgi:6-phosphogluconolactonase